MIGKGKVPVRLGKRRVLLQPRKRGKRIKKKEGGGKALFSLSLKEGGKKTIPKEGASMEEAGTRIASAWGKKPWRKKSRLQKKKKMVIVSSFLREKNLGKKGTANPR